MRCQACDRNLSDQEATNICVVTGEHPDLCTGCLKECGVEVVNRTSNRSKPVDAPDPVVVDEEMDLPDPYEESLGG